MSSAELPNGLCANEIRRRFLGRKSTSIRVLTSWLCAASRTCRDGRGSIDRLTSGWKKAPVSIVPVMSILHPNCENRRLVSLLCEIFNVVRAGKENSAGGNSANELFETSRVVRHDSMVSVSGKVCS